MKKKTYKQMQNRLYREIKRRILAERPLLKPVQFAKCERKIDTIKIEYVIPNYAMAPEYSSPTYNLRDMFVACMDWDYHQGEWYPLMEVLPKIEHGIHELTFNRKKYIKYEPDNGWGDITSALKALQSILDYFKGEWIWGWNGEIPKDCIYMRW